jgi:hypothetical protein
MIFLKVKEKQNRQEKSIKSVISIAKHFFFAEKNKDYIFLKTKNNSYEHFKIIELYADFVGTRWHK